MSTQADGEERVLHFPEDRSLGMLFLLETDEGGSAWEELSLAHGEVTVPAGQAVKLVVSPEAIQDLSPLADLEPDAIDTVELPSSEIDGESVRHLSALTSLRGLYLGDTSVTDGDLVHLRHLTLLEELDLSWTGVTDAGLIHVGELRSL